jgi:ribose/xylose/arabinose/galactoside ABC-type transport system permease subunit
LPVIKPHLGFNRTVFLALLIVAIGAAMSFVSPYFLSLQSILDMTQFGAVVALLGLGQTLVIVGGQGGIDLSVGTILSLAGVVMAMAMSHGVNLVLAGVLAVGLGAFLGFLNGLLVTTIGMPPLIVTLGTSYIYSSIALVSTNGVPVGGLPDAFRFIGQGKLLGIPAQVVLVVLPAFLALNWFIGNSTFGRSVYMVGVNDTAARLTGVKVKRVRTLLYAISGGLAGLGAIVMTSWLMAAKPDIGTGLDMQSITVAVLGGTAIAGGEGRLLGTIMAVIVLTMITYGMQLGNITSVWQLAVLGALLLTSIAVNNLLDRRSAV